MNINEIVEKNKAGLLISVLGCLIFFVASFFGHNYVWEDNIILSLFFSLVATLSLFFISLFLIKSKNDPNRKGISILEIVLLTCYALVAIVSSLFVMHFINTEFAFKESIKTMGLNKVAVLYDIKEKYEVQTEISTSLLKTQCQTLVINFIGSTRSSEKASYRSELISDYNFSFGINDNKESLLNKCDTYKTSKQGAYNSPLPTLRSSKDPDMAAIKQVFASYSRRKVPEALKWIDDWTISDLGKLKVQYPEFNYTIPDYPDVPELSDLGESLRHPKAQNGVAIGFLSLIHLMILGWYLFWRGRRIYFPDKKAKI